jgi:hypothetical protein
MIVESINKGKVNDDLVETLELLLKEAKSGNLQCLLFVDRYVDGSIASDFVGSASKSMIAELEDLKFLFFSTMYLQQEEEL